VIERYGEEFYRMWRLYLGSSASGFRYGQLGLSQFTFTRLAQTGQPLTRGYLYQ
jgi:cyclopropane-fatty-acyl-phospholipid synthase